MRLFYAVDVMFKENPGITRTEIWERTRPEIRKILSPHLLQRGPSEAISESDCQKRAKNSHKLFCESVYIRVVNKQLLQYKLQEKREKDVSRV
jgi:hypothetical protein